MSDKLRAQDGDLPNPGRRGLLTGAYLTREGRENVRRKQKPLGPSPPWHQQVKHDCSHCQKECVNACSQKIIRVHQGEHAHAGTPWLDFSVTGCTFCGDCAEACPAIENFEKDAAQTGDLQVDNKTCLSWNDVLCMACIGKCDVRALRLDERRRLTLKDSLCTGCGMCIHACPVDALVIQY